MIKRYPEPRYLHIEESRGSLYYLLVKEVVKAAKGDEGRIFYGAITAMAKLRLIDIINVNMPKDHTINYKIRCYPETLGK